MKATKKQIIIELLKRRKLSYYFIALKTDTSISYVKKIEKQIYNY